MLTLISDSTEGAFFRIAAKLECNLMAAGKLSTGELLFAFLIILEPPRAFPNQFKMEYELTKAANTLISSLKVDCCVDEAVVERYLSILQSWESAELLEEISNSKVLLQMYEENETSFNGKGKESCKNRIKGLEERLSTMDPVHKAEALLDTPTNSKHTWVPTNTVLIGDDAYADVMKSFKELYATKCKLSKYNGVDRRLLVAIEAEISRICKTVPPNLTAQMSLDLAEMGIPRGDLMGSSMM
jgi:hypothetical protein